MMSNSSSSAADFPPALSAQDKSSFAFKTVKDRLPIILTKVVDTTHRQKAEILASHGEAGGEDLKQIIGALSELRYRLATDKELTDLESDKDDVILWKQILQEERERNGGSPVTWFSSPWLIIECYFYRKIATAFERSIFMREWDPFRFQKEQAFVGSLPAMKSLGDHLADLLNTHKSFSEEEKLNTMQNLFQISLWGNKCDLSISAGESNYSIASPINLVNELQSFILVNDCDDLYRYLKKNLEKTGQRVDFILDNAGLELFGDLCLAEFLLDAEFTGKIVFHVKAHPWFVSDTTFADFSWTLEMLRSSDHPSLNQLGHKWHKRMENGDFQVVVHRFWTLGCSFWEMGRVAPDLYADLEKSGLLVFKGDLNYRKLVSDLKWEPDADFRKSLHGFCPAPLVALRTLKADTVTGLKAGQSETIAMNTGLEPKTRDWMITGEYAVIQFVEKL